MDKYFYSWLLGDNTDSLTHIRKFGEQPLCGTDFYDVSTMFDMDEFGNKAIHFIRCSACMDIYARLEFEAAEVLAEEVNDCNCQEVLPHVHLESSTGDAEAWLQKFADWKYTRIVNSLGLPLPEQIKAMKVALALLMEAGDLIEANTK